MNNFREFKFLYSNLERPFKAPAAPAAISCLSLPKLKDADSRGLWRSYQRCTP